MVEDIFAPLRNQQGTNVVRNTRQISLQNQEIQAKKQAASQNLAMSKISLQRNLLAGVVDNDSLKVAKDKYLQVFPNDSEQVNKFMPQGFDKKRIDQEKRELMIMEDKLKPLVTAKGSTVRDPLTWQAIAGGGGQGGEPVGGKEIFDRENKLRTQFLKQSGDFIKVRDSFGRIEAAAEDPSAAGDLALIFNYMKVLDPGSVVRESEFATAENAAGVPTRIRNVYNKVMNGQKLGPTQRKDFVGRAGKLFKSQKRQQDRLSKEFSGLATRAGVQPENVTIDVSFQGLPRQETPITTKEQAQSRAAQIEQTVKANNPNLSDIEIDKITAEQLSREIKR